MTLVDDVVMSSSSSDDDDVTNPVISDLRKYLDVREESESNSVSSLWDKSATAIPVAAIKTLLGVVQRSVATTMMGLQQELLVAVEQMQHHYNSTGSNQQHQQQQQQHHPRSSYIALQSGCDLFLKYITRTFLELTDFAACKQAVLERGERFREMSLAARDRCAHSGSAFVSGTVLTLGWSRVVASVLHEASHKQQPFQIILLQGGRGEQAAHSYAQETNIPVTVVPDAAMAMIMERVDMVLVGAEGVLENGGIVNQVGTYAVAICAHAHGKPFYVAAESYKFARLYPLSQADLPHYNNHNHQPKVNTEDSSISKVKVENPYVDFTPAKFITLLFTDLGVLTPSAVSDELIRLYQ